MLNVPICSSRSLSFSVCALIVTMAMAISASAQQLTEEERPASPPEAKDTASREAITSGSKGNKKITAHQTELEAKLSKTLSGATLEGSYTITGPGIDPSNKLNREKYTLGEVKKVTEDIWQFPTRIQYSGKDITVPIALPIRWAGDTPIVVVDEVMLPGFGTVSARVLFFDGHYAGYWKHGEHSGNLFGEIHPASKKPATEKPAQDAAAPSESSNAPAGKQPQK